MKKSIIAFIACLFAFSPAYADGSKVVVTIKPLHSLVAAVMEGDGNEAVLLLDGSQSPHHFSLKPSQVKAMHEAKAVFYMGENLESFMSKTLSSLPETVRRVPLENSNALSKLSVRTSGGLEDEVVEGGHEGHHHAHDEDEEHEGHHHAHSGFDMHMWMSPLNAKHMVMEIAQKLSMTFPEKRSIYFANLRTLGARLTALDDRIEQRMASLRGKPYVTFHDAYQYFEKRYGLHMVGAITLNPEHGVGAKRLRKLREKIAEMGAVCVFREPQFDAKIVDNLLEGTEAKSGVLDSQGLDLTPGAELYFQLIENTATGLESCFKS